MAETTAKKRNVGLWVSTLYFAEGFPYTVVNLMSAIFLKDFGASNQLIGLTSFLSLPWTLKGLWGPVVDLYSTKRRWILITEIVCTFLFVVLAITPLVPYGVAVSIFILGAIAFVSATHDIAIDGFYLDALSNEQQAFYVGWRSTAYKIALLVGSGGLVFLAGTIKPLKFGWAVAFALSALIFILVYCFQLWYLPHLTDRDRHFQAEPGYLHSQAEPGNEGNRHFQAEPGYLHSQAEPGNEGAEPGNDISYFLKAFKTYFTQYKIGWIVTYVLIFRLGDAFLLKMAPLFLKDPVDKGGLNISTAEMGILYGTAGVIFLLSGGILGGYIIAKQGLNKWMWPTALLQNSAILLYWLLAIYQPSIEWAYIVNSFEQFSYGVGVSAYTVFLMGTVRPESKASHYAITTAFMAAGVLIPGIFSGYLQARMGYQNYFLMSFLASLPGLAAIFFLPIEEKQ